MKNLTRTRKRTNFIGIFLSHHAELIEIKPKTDYFLSYFENELRELSYIIDTLKNDLRSVWLSTKL
jgi:hypothetical protein